ncbi:MAG: MFS transporter permease [Desulfobacterales bacterium]|nr:MFS transporter permease [Desulfobacterales bacterium]
MSKKCTEIVIPKEEAVFWLDKNGRWHNAHGEFEHKKIIAFFHAAIKKDAQGYYLYQERENIREKVYFHCEDTALFAVDLIIDPEPTLILNTRKSVRLKPKNLFIKNDSLYMKHGAETIKIVERALQKISDLLTFEDTKYIVKVNNRRYKIPEK